MKQNIVIFSLGVIVGYLLCKVVPFNKVSAAVSDAKDTITGNTSDVKPSATVTQISDDEKMKLCEEKLNEATRTMRFGSVDEMNTYRTQFINDCMSAKT